MITQQDLQIYAIELNKFDLSHFDTCIVHGIAWEYFLFVLSKYLLAHSINQISAQEIKDLTGLDIDKGTAIVDEYKRIIDNQKALLN